MTATTKTQAALAAAARPEEFRRARAVLERGIREHAFPGAAAAIVHGEKVELVAAGCFTDEPESPATTPESIFDLASITKVFVTIAAMILDERGQLQLGSPAATLVPELLPSESGGHDRPKRAITLRMLLAHTSGLPAHARLWEQVRGNNAEEILRLACALPLAAAPGERALYSDIGFIILGAAVARAAGAALADFCRREIFSPLAMAHTGFLPAADWKPLIPPTLAHCPCRGRRIQGEVNDENASAMGGVAGHAGIFAPAGDLARFAQCLLRGGAPILKPATLELFTRRSPGGGCFALGWDTPSAPSQSGRYFSPRSFGHLGYTGTSLWVDPHRRLAVALLSNRTWPDAASQGIKNIRPAFHDAVAQELGIA